MSLQALVASVLATQGTEGVEGPLLAREVGVGRLRDADLEGEGAADALPLDVGQGATDH